MVHDLLKYLCPIHFVSERETPLNAHIIRVAAKITVHVFITSVFSKLGLVFFFFCQRQRRHRDNRKTPHNLHSWLSQDLNQGPSWCQTTVLPTEHCLSLFSIFVNFTHWYDKIFLVLFTNTVTQLYLKYAVLSTFWRPQVSKHQLRLGLSFSANPFLLVLNQNNLKHTSTCTGINITRKLKTKEILCRGHTENTKKMNEKKLHYHCKPEKPSDH